ncbi:MAG: TIR domain-containing protein [Geobacteraceae bacterium]|nr:TIR domain-containing protein [Geobacteraceae bacterium]
MPKPSIFISHRWAYQEECNNLIQKLDEYGFSHQSFSVPQHDPLDRKHIDKIRSALKEQIRQCNYFIVFARMASDSEWCRYELQVAKELGKPILSVRPWGYQGSIPDFITTADSQGGPVGFNIPPIVRKICSQLQWPVPELLVNSPEKSLFVVMPFGVKPLPDGKSELNFDHIYQNIIRPAGAQAGWKVTRIDDIVHPGPISDDYLREIFFSDLVLADISVPNANVYYELGIRHAISSGGTLLLAIKGTPLPFDLSHLRVLFYDFSPKGIKLARTQITEALTEYHPVTAPTTNPIRTFLEKLGTTSKPSINDPNFEDELLGRINRAKNSEQLIAVWRWARNLTPLPAHPLLSLADRLADYEAWHTSVEVLKAAIEIRPSDFEIHRQLGWHLRHLGPDSEEEAITSLKLALHFNPGDPESLGMLAGILKRRKEYAEAAKLYDRGAMLSPDSLYMRVNQAALSIMLHPQQPEPGIELYRKLYEDISKDSANQSEIWTELVLGEAAFAIGNKDVAESHFTRAASLNSSLKELRSAAEQIQLLGDIGFKTDDAQTLLAFIESIGVSQKVVEVIAATKSNRSDLPVIIHLSDIHFGSKLIDGKATVMHRFHDGEYERKLSTHIISEFTSRRAHFNHKSDQLYLVVSGDLTFTAERAEFAEAKIFLEEVCSGLGISKERVLLVPGNHDVHWSSIQVDVTHRFDNYLGFLLDFYGEELFRLRYPKITWDFHVNSVRPQPSQILAFYSGDGFTLIGLNSCVYETNQDHYGFIGGRQLDSIADLIDLSGGTNNDLRIAVLHHHLHPFPEPIAISQNNQVWTDLSTIRDAGLVERRLERLGFDVVMHGHKHKAQLRETLVRDRDEQRTSGSRLIVCGAGSVGVNSKELEHNYSNQYQVVEIMNSQRNSGTEFLNIEWRELSLIPGSEWGTSHRWVVLG